MFSKIIDLLCHMHVPGVVSRVSFWGGWSKLQSCTRICQAETKKKTTPVTRQAKARISSTFEKRNKYSAGLKTIRCVTCGSHPYGATGWVKRILMCLFNPFTTKSDQVQISPAALPDILHHTVWRTWLFLAYSMADDITINFSLDHLCIYL